MQIADFHRINFDSVSNPSVLISNLALGWGIQEVSGSRGEYGVGN